MSDTISVFQFEINVEDARKLLLHRKGCTSFQQLADKLRIRPLTGSTEFYAFPCSGAWADAMHRTGGDTYSVMFDEIEEQLALYESLTQEVAVDEFYCVKSRSSFGAQGFHSTGSSCSGPHFQLYYKRPPHRHTFVARVLPATKAGFYDARVACDQPDCAQGDVEYSGTWEEVVRWTDDQMKVTLS